MHNARRILNGGRPNPRAARRILALVACAACAFVCLALVACGAGGTGQQAASEPAFTGREARDAADLDTYVDEATKAIDARKAETDANAEEGEAAGKSADDFASANDKYRAGEYAEAQELYESILATEPLHYGANVNLTLALLQQGKTDESFTQALVCAGLYSDDSDVLLNAQASGAACGFASADIEGALRRVLGVDDTLPGLSNELRGTGAWDYNTLWNDIETVLYGDQKRDAYEDLQTRSAELQETIDDEDARHLAAYLDAVGESLGFADGADADKSADASDSSGTGSDASSSDTSSSDASTTSSSTSSDSTATSSASAKSSGEALPIEKFPTVLFEDVDCILAIVDSGPDAKTGELSMSYTFNNTSNEERAFVFADDWKLNGTDVKLPEVDTLCKNKELDLSVSFINPFTDEGIAVDLESFEGTILIQDADGGELGAVHVTYEA